MRRIEAPRLWTAVDSPWPSASTVKRATVPAGADPRRWSANTAMKAYRRTMSTSLTPQTCQVIVRLVVERGRTMSVQLVARWSEDHHSLPCARQTERGMSSADTASCPPCESSSTCRHERTGSARSAGVSPQVGVAASQQDPIEFRPWTSSNPPPFFWRARWRPCYCGVLVQHIAQEIRRVSSACHSSRSSRDSRVAWTRHRLRRWRRRTPSCVWPPIARRLPLPSGASAERPNRLGSRLRRRSTSGDSSESQGDAAMNAGLKIRVWPQSGPYPTMAEICRRRDEG